ncbi:MAG: hypothetical protein ACTHQM_20640, partial [Thermoanaerobaculia bacterium]
MFQLQLNFHSQCESPLAAHCVWTTLIFLTPVSAAMRSIHPINRAQPAISEGKFMSRIRADWS